LSGCGRRRVCWGPHPPKSGGQESPTMQGSVAVRPIHYAGSRRASRSSAGRQRVRGPLSVPPLPVPRSRSPFPRSNLSDSRVGSSRLTLGECPVLALIDARLPRAPGMASARSPLYFADSFGVYRLILNRTRLPCTQSYAPCATGIDATARHVGKSSKNFCRVEKTERAHKRRRVPSNVHRIGATLRLAARRLARAQTRPQTGRRPAFGAVPCREVRPRCPSGLASYRRSHLRQ
jgi:hypothetical protein